MRCPVCKADNNTTPQCRRCKADLSLLVALEERRARALAEAAVRLWQLDGKGALAAANQAAKLRRDEEAQRLQALGCLLDGDYAGAWALYAFQRIDSQPAGSLSVAPR